MHYMTLIRETAMQLGMVGLGRMGANMVQRLLNDGHECVVFDTNPASVEELAKKGATPSDSLQDLCSKLTTPRNIWIMVPAAIVDKVIVQLIPVMEPGDTIIDGGNSNYRDDIHHAETLKSHGLHFIDCGTSGGVYGLERGYCLMIGGESDQVEYLDAIFKSLAPAGNFEAKSTAEQGYLHCGPSGAGHFVKMVHNGIEYALMAAYAEGFNLLKHAGVGKQESAADAETAPMENARYYQYDFDVADIAEVWRKGSVISSWLLDLTAQALQDDADLTDFGGKVSDSGEGRWTCQAAIETGTPAPLLTTALYERFSSRNESEFANKLLSAMRFQFGGHHEKK
jgi:6-phosphogluconate dehydrogenase